MIVLLVTEPAAGARHPLRLVRHALDRGLVLTVLIAAARGARAVLAGPRAIVICACAT